MNIGIIGSEAAKFDFATQSQTMHCIESLIAHEAGVREGMFYADGDYSKVTVVSGHCHLGGVDIWAENIADQWGASKLIFPPAKHQWEGGYKQRNIKIAENSDKIIVITLKELPPSYKGMRFKGCYHCDGRHGRWDSASAMRQLLHNAFEPHVKSGACWTAWYAVEKLHKPAEWIII